MGKRYFDLFGNACWDGEGKAGRPPHEATAENVRKVRLLVLARWPRKAIAAELGISEPTLRAIYFGRADVKAAQEEVRRVMRAKALFALDAQVEAGNVGAAKAMLRIVEGEEIRDLPPALTEPAKAQALGKKDQRRAAARSPKGKWGELVPAGPPAALN